MSENNRLVPYVFFVRKHPRPRYAALGSPLAHRAELALNMVERAVHIVLAVAVGTVQRTGCGIDAASVVIAMRTGVGKSIQLVFALLQVLDGLLFGGKPVADGALGLVLGMCSDELHHLADDDICFFVRSC